MSHRDFTAHLIQEMFKLADEYGEPLSITRTHFTLGDFRWNHQYAPFEEAILPFIRLAIVHFETRKLAHGR